MPHLIKGKMRFTDEDHEMSEFNNKVECDYKSTSIETLHAMLNQQLAYQSLLKEPEITEKFDITNNIKKSLSNSLSILLGIANKEGYTLNNLISFSLQ
jgi:hypothetical protein